MATAICKINLGLKEQTLFIQDNGEMKNYQLSLNDLSNFIVEKTDINEVIFSGPRQYVKKIEQETKEKEKSKYTKIKTKFIYI